MKRDGIVCEKDSQFNWSEFGFQPLCLDWELHAMDDFEFSMPFGIEMVNSVITKPYSIINDVGADELPVEYR